MVEFSSFINVMKSNAIVITGEYLATGHAKTAHGLIRGTDRFHILAIIDKESSGKDAGEVLDGKKRNIPVYKSITDFLSTTKEKASYCIVGVATKGGIIPDSLRAVLKEALENGYSIVNGLHEYVSDNVELAALARQKNLEIIDVRKPKKVKDLHFWSGRIRDVKCPKIAVLGTDCALGKRTTTRFLVEAMRNAGYKAEMIYTGQTGWMQGAKHGFVFDSTLNDFISGEMEHAVVSCYEEEKPDIIFIEGQSSLRNPSGPAGAEWLVSARADGVILQHNPERKKYKGLETYDVCLPPLKDEIALIKMYGVPTIGITINGENMTTVQAREATVHYEKELHIPTILPLEDGVERFVPVFEKMISEMAFVN